jgi:hypothetical protein
MNEMLKVSDERWTSPRERATIFEALRNRLILYRSGKFEDLHGVADTADFEV